MPTDFTEIFVSTDYRPLKYKKKKNPRFLPKYIFNT